MSSTTMNEADPNLVAPDEAQPLSPIPSPPASASILASPLYDGRTSITDPALERPINVPAKKAGLFDRFRKGVHQSRDGHFVQQTGKKGFTFNIPSMPKLSMPKAAPASAPMPWGAQNITKDNRSLASRAAAVGRVLKSPTFIAQAVPSALFGAGIKWAVGSGVAAVVGSSLAATVGVAIGGGALASMVVGGLRHDYEKSKQVNPSLKPVEKNWAKAVAKDLAGFTGFSLKHVFTGAAAKSFVQELKHDKKAILQRAGMGALFGGIGFGLASLPEITHAVHGFFTPDDTPDVTHVPLAAAPAAPQVQASVVLDATAPLTALDAQALKDQAVDLYNGINGVAQDKEAALALFRQAAEAGNHQAIRDLAQITGEHVTHTVTHSVAAVAAAPDISSVVDNAPVAIAIPVPDIQPQLMVVPPLVDTQPVLTTRVAAQCVINPSRFGEADCAVNQSQMVSGDSVLFTNETTGLTHKAVLEAAAEQNFNVVDFFSGVVSRNFNKLVEATRFTEAVGPVNYVAQQASENIQTAAINDNVIIPDFSSAAPGMR